MSKLTAQARKEEIVQAAILLFSEKGFRGTTTKGLAKKAGVSEALLFRHFPDKKSLYQEILATKMEERCSELLANLPLSGSVEKVLRRLSLRIVEQHVKDPSFLRLLLFSALEGHDLSDLFFQRRNLPLSDFLIRFFQKGIENEKLKINKPELAARAFLDMVYGFINTKLLFRIPQVVQRPIEETLTAYITIFLKGIS